MFSIKIILLPQNERSLVSSPASPRYFLFFQPPQNIVINLFFVCGESCDEPWNLTHTEVMYENSKERTKLMAEHNAKAKTTSEKNLLNLKEIVESIIHDAPEYGSVGLTVFFHDGQMRRIETLINRSVKKDG